MGDSYRGLRPRGPWPIGTLDLKAYGTGDGVPRFHLASCTGDSVPRKPPGLSAFRVLGGFAPAYGTWGLPQGTLSPVSPLAYGTKG